MTPKLSAPNPAAECKFLRDAELRKFCAVEANCFPEGTEVIPIFEAIFVVVTRRNTDADRDYPIQSAANRATMQKITAPKRRNLRQLSEPELIVVRPGDGPDPRLVELARLLARRAAREWYNHTADGCRTKRH
jgi:hypothetical protein